MHDLPMRSADKLPRDCNKPLSHMLQHLRDSVDAALVHEV